MLRRNYQGAKHAEASGARWAESKIMSPSAYFTAAVVLFPILVWLIRRKALVNKQTVADLFKVSKSNLHQITSGRKYGWPCGSKE